MKKEVPVKRNTGSSKPLTKDAVKYSLSDKEVEFAKLYTNGELMGNGIQSYAQAYNVNLAIPGKYNVCKARASTLLKKPEVLNYIKSIFEHYGLNDADVDSQLLFCINQMADMQAKVQAIKIYYELSGRIKKAKEPTAIQFNINIESGTTVDTSHAEENRSELRRV